MHKYTAQADDSSVATECGCAEGCLGDRGGGTENLRMRCILRRDNALTPLSGSNLLLNLVSGACVTTNRVCNGVRRSRLT